MIEWTSFSKLSMDTIWSKIKQGSKTWNKISFIICSFWETSSSIVSLWCSFVKSIIIPNHLDVTWLNCCYEQTKTKQTQQNKFKQRKRIQMLYAYHNIGCLTKICPIWDKVLMRHMQHLHKQLNPTISRVFHSLIQLFQNCLQ